MSSKWNQSTRWTSSAPANKHGTNGNRRRGFVHADSDQTAFYVDYIAEDAQCRIARGIVNFRIFTNCFSMDLSELFTNRHDLHAWIYETSVFQLWFYSMKKFIATCE